MIVVDCGQFTSWNKFHTTCLSISSSVEFQYTKYYKSYCLHLAFWHHRYIIFTLKFAKGSRLLTPTGASSRFLARVYFQLFASKNDKTIVDLLSLLSRLLPRPDLPLNLEITAIFTLFSFLLLLGCTLEGARISQRAALFVTILNVVFSHKRNELILWAVFLSN